MSYDDETSRTLSYARHDTLEGLLQRGRGLGAQRARCAPAAAAPFVYDGIRRDWKWDSQCDDRYLYQARLIRDLKLSPAPVADQLAGDEEECPRVAPVLRLLALAGSDEAREGLRAYIRTGKHWVSVLQSVADSWPTEWWEDLGDVARARIGGEEELPWSAEPWGRFGIQVPGRTFRPRPSLGGLSDEELLALLAADGTEFNTKVDALRALAGREPAEGLIPLVPSLGARDGSRPLPLLRRAVDRLGALAVPAARGWAVDGQEWLARLGAYVLADHPGPEAIPGLVAELAEQWETRTWCGPDTTAKRLARFGPEAADAVPVLWRYWRHTPHSYERTDYLTALAAIDPSGLDDAYTESLWDCEERARLLGIASAPHNPQTLHRIAELRDDPMEEPEVRAAAGASLAAGPPDGLRLRASG
ncbi:hypothetical protein OHA37_01055 [Streptomyces sp. NBC_00335]|uniref:hypothetical protein n=1 Tax=unclassified Streptomyces TaxID=2593676 RepID=UPI002254696D|nr:MULTISPECIES: hypothetical protein [unclassified Streptomyces]MCX5402474.1 hypothetical protein [Streptomyces sp. NBC_00086]